MVVVLVEQTADYAEVDAAEDAADKMMMMTVEVAYHNSYYRCVVSYSMMVEALLAAVVDVDVDVALDVAVAVAVAAAVEEEDDSPAEERSGVAVEKIDCAAVAALGVALDRRRRRMAVMMIIMTWTTVEAEVGIVDENLEYYYCHYHQHLLLLLLDRRRHCYLD